MRLEKLNLWLTFAANFGVIGGLVFLGYEMQQNSIQLRAQASYSINEALSMLNSAVYNDAVLADIVLRGERDLSSLNPTEQEQFVAFQFDRINLAIHILTLENEGLADVHFPLVEFLIQEYERKPGLQEFLVLIEDDWVGAPELYERLRTGSD